MKAPPPPPPSSAKKTPAFKPDAWCVANTLLGAIRDESDLSFLAKAIHELDFDDVLSNPKATVSVFAPTGELCVAGSLLCCLEEGSPCFSSTLRRDFLLIAPLRLYQTRRGRRTAQSWG